MTRIFRPATPSDDLGPLRDTLRELAADLKGLRRDVDDLDERFRAFKGRVAKREQRAAAEDGGADDTPGDAAAGRHPEVVSVLRRRGQ